MKKLILLRKLSQIFFLGLFVYILWSTTYPLAGSLSPEIFFQTDSNIMILTSISERILLPGLLYSLGMLLITFIFGRFFCGWICPLGTVIDWTGARRGKKRSLTDKENRSYRKIKFFFLGLFFIAAVWGIQITWTLDPMVISARFVSMNLIPTFTLLVERTFIFFIKNFNLYGGLYDLYNTMKSSFLGIKVFYFSNAFVIFIFSFFVVSTAFFVSRLWCRMLCPLGAIYALVSKFSLLKRIVEKCINCKICSNNCRMGAINDDMTYEKSECILCMDCIYDCPEKGTRFVFNGTLKDNDIKNIDETGKGVTRKQFLFVLAGAVLSLGFFRKKTLKNRNISGNVIRPPMSLAEDDFLDRCVRCGNCMKVCPTNGLQPVMLESGLAGIWTPQLVPEIGYCEYKCNLCGNVCPTGAIQKISKEQKPKVKLGTAKVDRSICLAWDQNLECIVCEEHCPVPNKAIKIKEEVIDGIIVKKPIVDPGLCVGCGICQTKCPVRPVRAIRVTPKGATRVIPEI